MAESSKSSTDFPWRRADLQLDSHTGHTIRRCRDCGVRKVLEQGFYRERTCRGGYRPECKRCHNRAQVGRARTRYQASRRGRYKQPDHRAER